MQADLSEKHIRIKQLENDINGLQSEFDTKLKEIGNLQGEHQMVLKQYRQLKEKENLKVKDSGMFSEYSVPDSLQYDPKVCVINYSITMYIQ